MAEKKLKVKSEKEKVENKKTENKTVKTAVGKKVAKSVEKEVVASSIPVKKEVKSTKKIGDTTINVLTTDGVIDGKMELSKELFAGKVNKQLMAQAVRVYLANQRLGTVSTKTRGEVEGSTKKIFKQKGTGNARHGSKRAPIFVKGGVALGPKPRDYSLDFPKKMKRAALISALTSQLTQNAIKVVSNLEHLELKTKVYAEMFENIECVGKTLMVIAKDEHPTLRAMRNLPKVDVVPASDVHTYAVLVHRHVAFTKKGVKELEERLTAN